MTTVQKYGSLLPHVMGYFKRQLSPDEKQELLEVLETYARELVPLIVPVTLLNRYVRKLGESHLAGQLDLYPHPEKQRLKNHVSSFALTPQPRIVCARLQKE